MTATKGNSHAAADSPRLLAGGNPQIPRGDGDAPVQAYVEAMPGRKRDVGRRLDDLIVRTVPEYFHIHEGDDLDEELAGSWVKQASELPGWVP